MKNVVEWQMSEELFLWHKVFLKIFEAIVENVCDKLRRAKFRIVGF